MNQRNVYKKRKYREKEKETNTWILWFNFKRQLLLFWIDKSENTETLYKDLQFIIQNFEVLSCFFFKEYYRFQQRNRVFAHILNKK